MKFLSKAYVDSLSENRRNRRDLSTVFNDQDNKFDNDKLTNLDSITVKKDTSDNEIANKKNDDSLVKIQFSDLIKQ